MENKLLRRLIPLLLVLGLCLPPAFAQAPEQVSLGEVEDRDFVQGLFKDKKWDFALEEAKTYLSKYPQGFFGDEMRFVLGQTLEHKGLEAKAGLEYEQIIKHYPGSQFAEDAYFHLALIKIRGGSIAEGEAYLTALKKRFPFSKYLKESHYAQGQIAFAKKQWLEAGRHFRAVVDDAEQTNELRSMALIQLAWSLENAGEREEAELHFKKLLKAPIDAEQKAKIAFHMGVNEAKAGEFKKARAWFINQRNEYPHPAYDRQSLFWYAEAVYLAEQKQPSLFSEWDKKEAIKSYSDNLKANPPYEPQLSRLHRGWLYLGLGDLQAAMNDFKELQDKNEAYAKDASLTQLRGGLYAKLKDYRSSNQMYYQALQTPQSVADLEETRFLVLQNHFLLHECDKVIWRSKELDGIKNPTRRQRFDFYVGSCGFQQKDCKRTLQHFRSLPLEGDYAAQIFKPALECFQAEGRHKEAVTWIEQGLMQPGLGNKAELLRIEGQLHAKLAEWPLALGAYEDLLQEDPKARLNPWVQLELAKVHDALSEPAVNQRFSGQPLVQAPQAHEGLALAAYEKASANLGQAAAENRLNLLQLRRQKHAQRGDWDQVEKLYAEAIELEASPKQKSILILELARFQLSQKKDDAAALATALRNHGMAARPANFDSTLLAAELYIKQKNAAKAGQLLQEVLPDLTAGEDHYFQVHFRLGEVLQSQEKWTEAASQYQLVAKAQAKHALQAKAGQNLRVIQDYLKKKGR